VNLQVRSTRADTSILGRWSLLLSEAVNSPDTAVNDKPVRKGFARPDYQEISQPGRPLPEISHFKSSLQEVTSGITFGEP